jgi:hypothetical protein
VNEVKLYNNGQSSTNVEFPAASYGVVVENPEDNDDKDWVSLNELGENLGLPHDGDQPQTISEQIVQVSAESSPDHPIPDVNSEIHRAVPPKNGNDDPTVHDQ